MASLIMKDKLMKSNESSSYQISLEEIISNARLSMQCLDSLRLEHNQILNCLLSVVEVREDVSSNNHLVKSIVDEKIILLKKAVDMIELAMSEAQMMVSFSNHIEHFEAERQKLRAQVRRLCQETAWLRDELTLTQHKLQESEQKCVILEEKNTHLEFMILMKKFQTSAIESEILNESTLQIELGFPDDEEPQQDPFLSSVIQASSISIGGGYEIPVRLRTLHNLVIQYASQGRYEVAVPLCKQALDDLEKSSGPDHPDVATMLNILALVYRDQGKYKDAANLLNDALQIREKSLGCDHPAVAATLNNLAVLYGKRGKYQEAEPLCKRALIIREKVLGKNHPDVAKQLNNLALLCQNQAKYTEVEEYYQRALNIYKNILGPDDPNVDKTKNNLASAYLKQGCYKQAEELYKEILNHSFKKRFPEITGEAFEPKQIWKHAENQELSKGESQEVFSMNDFNNWLQILSDNSLTIRTTLKNLAALYRRQQRNYAADTIDHLITSKQE